MAVSMIFATPPPEWKPVNANWQVQLIGSAAKDATALNDAITERINEMKPKNINSIKAFIRQDPKPAGDFTVVVFCDSAIGDSAPIKVKVAQANLTHSDNPKDFLNILKSTRGNSVVLGFPTAFKLTPCFTRMKNRIPSARQKA